MSKSSELTSGEEMSVMKSPELTSGEETGKKRGPKFYLIGFGILVLVAVLIGISVPPKSGALSPIAKLFSDSECFDPCVPGSEDIMKPKAHGTSEYPVQENLRWGCEFELADRISNFNRHFAEFSGYWETTSFLSDFQEDIAGETGQVTFYDSGWKGSPLFIAPHNRTWEEFIDESTKHGWPSFRDSEVDWDYARVLPGGEMVSIDGTHLGHNLPDRKGNRYCINLVSIAGTPP